MQANRQRRCRPSSTASGQPLCRLEAAPVSTDAPETDPIEPEAPAEEPKPILLWRPGRFERQGQRRHDHRPRHGRGPAGAGAETGAEIGDPPTQRQREGGRPPFQGRREGGEGADAAGKPKFNRDRYKGPPKPQGEGGRPDFRKGKPQEGRNENRGPKPAFQPRPREERPAQIDPLSPFAKLAALRDQLQPKK